MSEQKENKPSLKERVDLMERLVIVQDQQSVLDLSNRIAEAGQKEFGLDVGESSVKGERVILGDVHITETTQQDSSSKSEFPKWLGAALAAAGLATGTAVVPAGAYLLKALTQTSTVIEQAAPSPSPAPQTPPNPSEQGGRFEIFRPSVNTAAPASADALTIYTATWCGACKYYAPIYNRLKSEGYLIRIVDIDKEPNKAVKSLPTTFFWRKGTKVPIGEEVGVVSYTRLKSILRK